MALIEQIGVRDSNGNLINPATADKQDQQMEDSTPQGDQGYPMQQREVAQGTGGTNQEREQLVFDTNMSNIFGNQPLTNNGRIKVEDVMAPEIVIQGAMQRANDEVKINLTGMGTLTLQTQGVWAGTLSFYASVDGQNWNVINGQVLNAAAFVVSTTTLGIWRFHVAGLLAFKVQFTAVTSGIPRVIMVATPIGLMSTAVSVANVPSVAGSNSTALLQNVTDTTYGRLIVQDNGYVKDALQAPQAFDPSQTYYAGDSVVYNGRIYRCILYTALAAIAPTGANWVLERNQTRSVVTTMDAQNPSDAKIKIQQDLAQYTRQVTELQWLNQKIAMMNDFLFQDCELLVAQDAGGQCGEKYSLGQDGSSHYLFEEIQ